MNSYNLRILFIRHAESQANTTPDIIVGRQAESQLTQLGKEQAQLLGQRLQNILNPYIYSSDLIRSIQTANIAIPEALQNTIKIIPELQEFTNGDWDGKKRQDIYTDEQLKKINTAGYLFTPPNGESQRMVQRRASNWLEDEILYNSKFQGKEEKTILIFSHGLVIKTLLHYILGFSDRYIYRFKLDNTGICEFRYTEEGWFPIAINDTKHLIK
ncbi:MAG: histidine phosphatase family protein [Minisyncoccia bacterium]